MSNSDLAPLLQDALQPALTAYQDLKVGSGCVDFLDLLIKARDLVRDNRGVREELQRRFTHYFVDEFQDTDPIQAEIILLLAADDPDETNWLNVSPISGKLFFVGDPKQFIYRFRRADVAIYQQVKQMLSSREGSAPVPRHELPQPAVVAIVCQRRFRARNGGNASRRGVRAARELAARNHR
jgi:ATP-dependent helicase/nuclease subunit A